MENVDLKIENNKLIITIDLAKEGRPSKSGLSTVIATTRGNVPIGHENMKLGLNLYKPVNR
ncbi:MAG: hypothetical protein DRI44_02680 [Chlamydiae bacterium]|nr:MAG: hypothetical protein DRI44_02680 [Chlamydiota bacterium]